MKSVRDLGFMDKNAVGWFGCGEINQNKLTKYNLKVYRCARSFAEYGELPQVGEHPLNTAFQLGRYPRRKVRNRGSSA